MASLKNCVTSTVSARRVGACVAVPPRPVGESPKKSEKNSSKRLRPPRRRDHPLLGEVDLAEILGFLRPVRTKPDPGRDCRSPVTLAKVLDGHLNPLSLGQ